MAAKSVRTENDMITSPRGLRSASSSSDVMSASGRSAILGLPTASPKPAYIAQGAAENLAATELDRPVSISESALDLVNGFLDQTLYNILGLSKSTSLPALKAAVPKLLKPRLGQAAVYAAEEDLRDMGDGEDVDGVSTTDQAAKPADFDLDLAWKLARLRCMAFARLGDMEDEDTGEYLEQENLEEYAHTSPISTNSNSTLFATSVLEFLGEQALCTAAQYAERRHTIALTKKTAEDTTLVDDDSEVLIDTSDMMQLGREGPLSRLWRSWRRDTRAFDPVASRSTTPAVLMSPNLGDQHHSRTNSLVPPDHAIPEEDSPRSTGTPSQIPLPMRDNDVDEIEVPGLSPDLDDEGREALIPVPEKSQRRPLSMIMVPGGYHSPPTPSSPTGPAYQERSPLRPHFSRVRSQSLPTPTQSPLASDRQNREFVSAGQNDVQEHSERSETPSTGQGAELHGEPADRDVETTPTAEPHGGTRASIISGAVGAIAGALGIEALRSSQKGKDRGESTMESEASRQPKKTVAEEIMGPSNHVAAPSDASTGASINNAGDFDSMHIPVVSSDDNAGRRAQREREVSDPEDLALSSADEENIARTTQHEPRNPGLGAAGTTRSEAHRGQQSIPSSPSSPKRMNREAAVFENHMIPMRQEEESEPQGTQVRQSMVSDTYATAPTSQRYSESHYSQADMDSTSLPIQRPDSGEQQSSARPAAVPMRGSSLEKLQPTHSHSASKSSQYSHHSQSSSNSSKLLGFQRDQNGRPLSQQRAVFKDGSSSHTPGHSRDTSLTTDKAAAGGAAIAVAGAAGTLAARRQHLRLRSDSEENAQVDEEKKKSLEILIKSDETLHYTLTPEQARPREVSSNTFLFRTTIDKCRIFQDHQPGQRLRHRNLQISSAAPDHQEKSNLTLPLQTLTAHP